MPESASGGAGPPEAAPIVVLTGDADLDAPTRAALIGLRPAARLLTDPLAALAAATETTGGPIVFDAGAPGRDPAAFRLALRERAPALEERLLVLLAPPGGAGATDPGGARHFLARPFPPRALAAYVASLGAPSDPTRAGATAVRPRLPSTAGAQRVYREACGWVEGVFAAARAGETPDLARCRPLAEALLTDLLRSNALVLKSLEPHGSYDLAGHCVNVAILAGKIAGGLGWDVDRALEVIQAGLVHDIGMSRLPERVLLKRGPLDEEELAEVRKHPLHGAEIVAALGARWEWLARAVRQEHERMRGQGYPAGARGEEIEPTARVLGVADVFEALSHPRAHRSPFTAFDALQKVVGMQREYFAQDVVSALVNEISSFPLDSFVQLSTGEIGQVVATNPDNLLRPCLLVLWDASWRPLAEPRPLDLESEPEITITRTLHEAELPIT